MAANPYSKYKKMQVETTDPVRLVIMLYDGAVKALRLAMKYAREKDFEKKGREMMRAHDIIFELLSTLDRENGGEIAKNLESLYVYMLRGILESNASNDFGKMEEIIGHLETLNDGWRALARQRGAETSAVNREETGGTKKAGTESLLNAYSGKTL